MSGSSGAVQSSTQVSEPWSELKPYMLETIKNAQALYSQPYQQYQGQTVADFSDSTLSGFDLGSHRAMLGAPDLSAARGSTSDISGGAFFGQGPTAQNNWLQANATGQNLNSNPWLQSDYTDKVIADNTANMSRAYATGAGALNDAMAARAGAFGGSAHLQKAAADTAGLANSVGQMANQYQLGRTGMGVQDYQNAQGMGLQSANLQQGAYANDMSNILQSNALAGQLSADDWKAADYLRSIGAQQEGKQQQFLGSSLDQWNQMMNAPYMQMNAFKDILSQFGGMGSTGTQTLYGGGQSPLGTIAGLGLLGAGAYNAWPKG